MVRPERRWESVEGTMPAANREKILRQWETLSNALRALIEVQKLDPKCPWTNHFEKCLERSERIRRRVDPRSVRKLADTVQQVYGGMGSYNDYMPVHWRRDGSWDLIAGTEDWDGLSTRVWEAADRLRKLVPQ